MFLIASAAYCTSELQSEFGALPPTFLPLGNKRLFQHQIERIPKSQQIYMTLPDGFSIAKSDKNWLLSHNVTLLFLPEKLRLGESIVAALNLMDFRNKDDLTLLYGDTLLLSYPNDENLIAISEVQYNYQWAYIDFENEPKIKESSNLSTKNTYSVVNGFFHFKYPYALIKSLIYERWHFLNGINNYNLKHPMNIIKTNDWLDFGHIHTYFHSKAIFTTQRSFNELIIRVDSVKKSSNDSKKIQAEALWFENIPSPLRKYLPQLLNVEIKENKISYELEYLHHTALNELFVFSSLPTMTWKRILESCFNFLDACQSYSEPNAKFQTLDSLFKDKTEQRLTLFCDANKINKEKKWIYNNEEIYSINDLLSLANTYLPKNEGKTTVIHGDFCFSNILFDFRTSNVKTIDPRGISFNGEISIYGDIRYDIAKLSHSIIGKYDWIIAGYYNVNHADYKIDFSLSTSDNLNDVQMLFIDRVKQKYELTFIELLAMQLHLFLSMLPLHADDAKRQFALFANAFRIAKLLEGALL